jgi:hypothetical protein
LRTDFFNWLLSARFFLENKEIQLKRRYGKTSPQVREYKVVTANEYDGHFAYRFFYKLRNYAQHWDWPPLNGRIQVDVDEDPTRWIELFFERSKLLSYDGWGQRLRRDLEGMPEEIHFEDLIDELMDAIARIAARVYEIDAPGMKESLRLLATYWEEMDTPDLRPCFLYADPELKEEEGFDILWIPFKPTDPDKSEDPSGSEPN